MRDDLTTMRLLPSWLYRMIDAFERRETVCYVRKVIAIERSNNAK